MPAKAKITKVRAARNSPAKAAKDETAGKVAAKAAKATTAKKSSTTKVKKAATAKKSPTAKAAVPKAAKKSATAAAGPNRDRVAAVWRRIEARLGPLASRLCGPMPADHPDSEIFDTALDTVWLPEALDESYDVHDGERPGPGVICPPLRLVGFAEACAFALGDDSEPLVAAALAAAEKLAAKHAASLRRQGLSSCSTRSQVWTLALGETGHRIALDTDTGWVIEERTDGTVKKLADDFLTWLESLADGSSATRPPSRSRLARRPR